MSVEEVTTANFTVPTRNSYWEAQEIPLAREHLIHPEYPYIKQVKEILMQLWTLPSDVVEVILEMVNLEVPEFGYHCWWASNGARSFQQVRVVFSNAIMTNDGSNILQESALSKCLIKSNSYDGPSGCFHRPMFQVRGVHDSTITHHLTYQQNPFNGELVRVGDPIPVKKRTDEAKEDQSSITVEYREFSYIAPIPLTNTTTSGKDHQPNKNGNLTKNSSNPTVPETKKLSAIGNDDQRGQCVRGPTCTTTFETKNGEFQNKEKSENKQKENFFTRIFQYFQK